MGFRAPRPVSAAAWRPAASRRLWAELALALILLGLALGLLERLLLLPVGPPSVLLGALLAAVLMLTAWVLLLAWREVGLRYRLDGDGLMVAWGWGRERIPWAGLSAAVPREQTRGEPSFRWPVPILGWRDGRWPRGGAVRDYATSAREQVVLITPRRIYLLSPRSRQAFLKAVEERLGQVGESGEVAAASAPWSRPLWRDVPGLSLLGLALMANLGLLATVAWRYARIPPVVALAYDSVGQVRWVAPKSQLFLLPLAGLAFVAVNTWLARRWLDGRGVPAYLLLAGLLLAQGLLTVALVRILT